MMITLELELEDIKIAKYVPESQWQPAEGGEVEEYKAFAVFTDGKKIKRVLISGTLLEFLDPEICEYIQDNYEEEME